MPTYPAIIFNHHRPRVLDVLSPALYFRLMRRCHDRHVWPKHDPVTYRHKPAVKYRKVEVAVETFADADVTAVVDAEGRLYEDLVTLDVAQDVFELCQALLR